MPASCNIEGFLSAGGQFGGPILPEPLNIRCCPVATIEVLPRPSEKNHAWDAEGDELRTYVPTQGRESMRQAVQEPYSSARGTKETATRYPGSSKPSQVES